jgi:hypothetical protein
MKMGLLLQSLALLACVTLMAGVMYACSCPAPGACGPVGGAIPCCGCGKVSSQCTSCTAEQTCTSGVIDPPNPNDPNQYGNNSGFARCY